MPCPFSWPETAEIAITIRLLLEIRVRSMFSGLYISDYFQKSAHSIRKWREFRYIYLILDFNSGLSRTLKLHLTGIFSYEPFWELTQVKFLEIRLFFIRTVVNKNPVLFFGSMKSTNFWPYSMNTNLIRRSVSLRWVIAYDFIGSIVRVKDFSSGLKTITKKPPSNQA